MGKVKIDIEEAVRLYTEGQNTIQLAARYGVTTTGIRTALVRAGQVLRGRGSGNHPNTYKDGPVYDDVIRSYQDGQSTGDIAERLKIGFTTVQRILQRGGVVVRPQGMRTRTIRIPDDPVDLGYVAGLLDGEGNIGIRVRPNRDITCRVSIYNTNVDVMSWLLRIVGGTVRWQIKRKEPQWLPLGAWGVARTQDVSVLLRALLPHLIIKREKAIQVLTLYEIRYEMMDSEIHGSTLLARRLPSQIADQTPA